jgi:asparagine synthase (glutamine-hydrolysing)
MCGIAGVISWDEKYRVTRETLQRMSSRIAHRGPDGEGFYLNHEQEITPERPQCGFAFRRLAILDPDPRAMQPFTIGDKTIVFNGEVYNFRELREELKKLRPEYPWRTTGDTEVLLLAYDVWGEACVDRLNGMFAFVVWDERRGTAYFARDRMGQKPLYYSELFDERADGGADLRALAFSSELPALKHVPWVDPGLDAEAIGEYLRWGYVAWDRTVFNRVLKQRPGTTVLLSPNVRNERFYFHMENRARHGSLAAARHATPATTRQLVRTAVERQLVADVPLGCFLSGGVDSSVVACGMAAARRGGDVSTFSMGFDDPRYDETSFAAAVARHLGTKHHEFRVTPDAAADLPKLAWVLGEPFGDSSILPTHYLSRETRRHVKVALSGDGGDELFGGYDRYRAVALASRLRAIPSRVRGAVATAAGRLPGGHPKSGMHRLRRLASSLHLSPAEQYGSYLRVFDERTLRELLSDRSFVQLSYCPTVEDEYRSAVEPLQGNLDPVRAALRTDRSTYLPDDLLAKVDRASMLHGLEVRSPFMDHELVEFAAGLTTDQLLKGGPKRMLREAFADDLPAWVFKRKKMGFAVPIGEWFRGELRPMLRDHLFAAAAFGRQHFNMKVVERLVEEHERQKVDHSQRLYALLMLELWWKTCR